GTWRRYANWRIGDLWCGSLATVWYRVGLHQTVARLPHQRSPIGALVTFGAEVSQLFGAGQHGTTFGGNPLATATALAVLETIESENLLANVNEVGQYLANKLRGLSSIKTVRAYGLWQGIELDTELLTQQGQTLPAAGLAPKVVAKALDYGYIINATDENTLRLAPPLIITKEQID